MPAPALATVAAPQMITRREDDERALAVKVLALDERLLFLQSLPLGLELTREQGLTRMDRIFDLRFESRGPEIENQKSEI